MDIDKNKVCDLVEKFCFRLNLPNKTCLRAQGIVNLIDPKNHIDIAWAEYDEIAAAAVYIGAILTSEKKTQKEIQKVCEVPIYKIKRTYSEMSLNLPIEIILVGD